MQKINLSILLFVFTSLVSFQWVEAQTWYEKKSEQHQKAKKYVDLLSFYERLIQNNVISEQILKRTADAYYFQGKYRSAYPKYKLLFRRYEVDEPEYYFRYMHSLKSVNRYDEANQLLIDFKNKFPKYLSEKDEIETYLNKIEAKKDDYDIGIVAVNSQEMDYAPSYYLDQIVFTSARDTGNFTKIRHQWNASPFTKLYVAKMDPRTKELRKPKLFAEKLNTNKYHESSTCFSKDGKTMYFTRNSFLDKKLNFSTSGEQKLKIYRATLQDEDWTNIEELAFNGNEFNTAHPALSPEENYLYFASDRPGGFGNSDIWRVKINDDNTFGNPENLGEPVNTSGKETYPFIAYNSILYFSSNMHFGLGGLDVFAAELQKDNSYQKVINLGSGVNSKYDDFSLIIDSTLTGFFASNRNVGKYKQDNIYRIKQRFFPNFDDLLFKKIKVVDEQTMTELKNVQAEVFNSLYEKTDTFKTDENGMLEILQNKDISHVFIRFFKEEYEVKEERISKSIFLKKDTLIVPLRKRMQEISVGKDIGKIIEIEKIYFDLDQSNIRPDAALELEKIVSILKRYPDISIEIGSHTDSRASKSYNKKLSQSRAQATRNWIISKGIESKRISAKGYGESQLVNRCKDNVDCTEEEHQQNRRSEFIVTKMKMN